MKAKRIPIERLHGQRFAVYDNGGKTVDRYTAVYLDQEERGIRLYSAVAMSGSPFHPQGFGQHCMCLYPNRGIGKRI